MEHEEDLTFDTLHWNYRNYAMIPEKLKNGKRYIKDLYLRGNHISRVPKWLLEFENLRELHMESNGLECIPHDIHLLKNLTVLDLGDNLIHELPDSIIKLTSLQKLNVCKNFITTIPEDLYKMTNLITLGLSYNRIQIVPDSISKCSKLEDLCLNGNRLILLPSSIIYLPRLEYLDLSQNDLIYFPVKQFVTQPIISYCDNPHLNYFSYSSLKNLLQSNPTLLQEMMYYTQMTPSKESYFDYQNLNNVTLTTIYEDTIILPKSLPEVYNVEHRVPPLTGLCLTKVYSMLKENSHFENDVKTTLPQCLIMELNDGPSFCCDVCATPVFGYVVIRLFLNVLAVEDLNYWRHYVSLFTCYRCFLVECVLKTKYIYYYEFVEVDWKFKNN